MAKRAKNTEKVQKKTKNSTKKLTAAFMIYGNLDFFSKDYFFCDFSPNNDDVNGEKNQGCLLFLV